MRRLKKVQRFLNYLPKRKGKVEWVSAPDIKRKVSKLISNLDINWVKKSRLFCYRSHGAKTYARARIWGLVKIWQKALKVEPAYILEVISENYDHLKSSEQEEILLHELAHIPSNFSGSLVPHFRKGKRNFKDRVKRLVVQYKGIK